MSSARGEEAMGEAYKSHRSDIETRLLEQTMLSGHRYFEKVVVDLLLARFARQQGMTRKQALA